MQSSVSGCFAPGLGEFRPQIPKFCSSRKKIVATPLILTHASFARQFDNTFYWTLDIQHSVFNFSNIRLLRSIDRAMGIFYKRVIITAKKLTSGVV